MAIGGIGTIQIGAPVGGLGLGLPAELRAYQNVDDTIILYWTHSPFSYSFYSFKWEVQTSLDAGFATHDDYLSDSVPSDAYLTGCTRRGIVVPIYARQDQAVRMYWRVRAIFGTDMSDWASSYYDIPSTARNASREAMLSFLPDAIYDKTPGTVPGVGSSTYKIHDTYAAEFENFNRQESLVAADNYISSARDAHLAANFGDVYGIIRPGAMSMLDFRETLRAFMTNIRSAPNAAAVINVVTALMRNTPVFIAIRDEYGVYDYDLGLEDVYVYEDNLGDKYVWDDEHLATGTIIQVSNQLACGTVITKDFVEGLIRNMVLVHTPTYVRFS